MIPLMKSTFLHEQETKEALSQFILSSPKLSMDTRCFEFERTFAAYQGSKDAVLFSSGGAANLAIFQALMNGGKLKKGYKVGFSAITWSTNVMPIIQMGLEPVPIDCEISTLNIMSNTLSKRLEEVDVQAVFVTNALGFCGDLPKIKKICERNGILLLEDNCESLGTTLPSGKTGSFGIASSFSFFVAHHMSTIEGGMVTTQNEELAEMLRIVRANGWDRGLNSKQQYQLRKKYKIRSEFEAKYTFYDLGFNMKPTEITGFLGLYQLQFLPESLVCRQKNYLEIEQEAKKNDDFITLHHSHISYLSSFAIPFICKTPQLREKYLRQFSGAGVEVRPIIAGNIQKQPFYRKYVQTRYQLPETEFIDSCGFYCGNYSELTQSDLETIKSCLKKY